MLTNTAHQLEAIHAMMATGHRSVRLERHTLILWGLAGAALILVTNAVFTPERFPVIWQRAIAANAFIALVLTAIGIWDYALTRRARRARDETLSFVQVQLTKVWWLLMGLIVAISLGMNLFGGGYMFYGIALAIVGLAFFIHGLFSEQMLSWAGVAMMALGLLGVALALPFALMEWLAIFAFGLGMPLLALLLGRTNIYTTRTRRLLLSIAWLALVTLPAFAATSMAKFSVAPQAPVIPLAEYLRPGWSPAPTFVVHLPAGTVVPIQIDVTGDILDGKQSTTLPMRLSRALDVAIRDGKPDGHFRVADGDWKQVLYTYRVRDYEQSATLSPTDGPRVSVRLTVSTDN